MPALTANSRRTTSPRYPDYGVVSIEFELAFDFEWETLVKLSATWIAAPEMERQAAEIVGSLAKRVGSALVTPYEYRLSEDYYIFQLQPLSDASGVTLSASEVISSYGPDIARIVRGEPVPLSRDEQSEVLQSRMSYYPNDLLVLGWNAAIVYDTAEGTGPTIQLLEYANSHCWSSATTITFSRSFSGVSMTLSAAARDSFPAGGWLAKPGD